MTSASTVLHTEFGAFCSVCQSHLSLEEEDFGVCDACGGEGLGCDDEPEIESRASVPIERLSLADWRRLHDATPGRNPTCGEIARFSEGLER